MNAGEYTHDVNDEGAILKKAPSHHEAGLARTIGMAALRNRYLEAVMRYRRSKTAAQAPQHLLVLDMDGACRGHGFNACVIHAALSRSADWDALSFMQSPIYWDLWALRQPDVMPENIYGPANSKNLANDNTQ